MLQACKLSQCLRHSYKVRSFAPIFTPHLGLLMQAARRETKVYGSPQINQLSCHQSTLQTNNRRDCLFSI